MKITKANPGELHRAIPLWQEVFQDTPSTVESIINGFSGEQNLWLAQQDGKVAAIGLSVPCTCGSTKGIYLYALATHPSYRRQGIMAKMMQEMEHRAMQDGAGFAALVPAEKSLFAYYESKGYTEGIALRRLAVKLVSEKRVPAHVGPVTAGEFSLLRGQYIPMPYLAFTETQYETILADFYAYGGQTIRTPEGYGMFFVQKEAVFVTELFAASQQQADKILNSIGQHTGCCDATVILAQNSLLFAGQGETINVASAKILQHGAVVPQYIRFVLEDLFALGK